MQKPEKKPKKKRKPHTMTPTAKIFVAGILIAFAMFAIGMPTSAWLGWKASVVQQSCDAQIQEKTEAVSKGPHATGNSIADAELGRMVALNTPQCQAASAAHERTYTFIYWLFRAPMLLVLLSAMPWLSFKISQINKF
jgi:hypothetical protein